MHKILIIIKIYYEDNLRHGFNVISDKILILNQPLSL